MSLIGPAGMSAASSAASHSAVVPLAEPLARASRSAPSRFSTRAPFVANRGSSASAGSPIARQNRGHCRSLPTATAISPSTVSNISYGTMLGWALPSRPGAAPSTNAFWAWLTRIASVDSKIDTSIRWPTPYAGEPVALPPGERRQDPDRRVEPGRDVGDRDADLRRDAAVRVGLAGDRHQAGLGLEQEVVAGAADERAGRAVAADREVDQARVDRAQRLVAEPEPLEAVRAGGSRRRRRRSPRRRRRTSAPDGCFRSSRRLRLLRLTERKYAAVRVPAASSPTHGGPQPRVESPSGGSTLTTSAPRSASSIVAYGPARTVEQSTTRMPARGPVGVRHRLDGSRGPGRLSCLHDATPPRDRARLGDPPCDSPASPARA